jgi:hypothetical protein
MLPSSNCTLAEGSHVFRKDYAAVKAHCPAGSVIVAKSEYIELYSEPVGTAWLNVVRKAPRTDERASAFNYV